MRMRSATIFLWIVAHYTANAESWLDFYFGEYPEFVQNIVMPLNGSVTDIPKDWTGPVKFDVPEFDLLKFSRSYKDASGEIWCVNGRIVFEEWRFSPGTCLIPHSKFKGKYERGMAGGHALVWNIYTNGVLCLVEYGAAFQSRCGAERIVFMDMLSTTNRFPCSFFSLEGFRLGMIAKEVDVLKYMAENKWDGGNAVKHCAGLIHPAFFLLGEIVEAIGRDVTKGIHTEIQNGFVVSISRHYTKKFMEESGGYSALLKKLVDKLGDPTTKKASRYYVNKKSAEWYLPKRDFCAILEQDDECVCKLTVSSLSRCKKPEQKVKARRKPPADFGF